MSPLRGVLLKLGSVVLFITMSSLIKSIADEVPPGQTVFFRSLFTLPVILAWLAWQRELRAGLRPADPVAHVWRGLIGALSMTLSFAALGLLPLPEVTAIGYATPLLTVVFAAMFLGETVRLFRIGAVALGLLGVLIVLAPRLTLGEPDAATASASLGAVLMLLASLLSALAQVVIRRMVQTERTSAIVWWFAVASTLVGLASLPFGWVVPRPATFVLLVLIGLVGGLGQILLTSAYRFADASLVAPFEYASLILALAIGYFVFAEVPTLAMLAGALLVVAAGILIIWRERDLGLERNRQRKAMTP
ncbi:MAG: DMT family transporter [Rhodobacteraceae bacterium]|nr:DMT family transporter [Paracoccaceae bacterium]